jgi:predicted alpha/beta-fold hydrolase
MNMANTIYECYEYFGFWIFVMLIMLFYAQIQTTKPKFHHCKKTAQIKFKSPISQEIKTISFEKIISEKCPSFSNPIHSHFLLPTGHLQTIWASLYAEYFATSRIEYTREYVQTPDSGVIGLDWTKLPSENPLERKTPYVFILHGLTGGSHETYVQDLILAVKEYGYESIVMHFRGCNNTPVKSAQLYSGAWTGDVSFPNKIPRDCVAIAKFYTKKYIQYYYSILIP